MSAKAAPKGRQATYADLEALPRHRLGEIIGDELVVSPRPGVLHAFATTVLTDTLSGPFLWLVDPVARTLEVLRRRGEDWLVAGYHGGEAKIRAVPFEAVELDLEALWPSLR